MLALDCLYLLKKNITNLKKEGEQLLFKNMSIILKNNQIIALFKNEVKKIKSIKK